VGVALAGSIAGVGLLTSFSASSEGPITAALEWAGTTAGSMERSVRQHLAGGMGRSGDLAWFRPYRTTPDRLRHPDTILLGAYDGALPDTLSGVVALENAIGTTLPLVQVYTAWGDKPDQRFPLRLATAIWEIGSVPVITWEPWLTDFESTRHPFLPLREKRDRQGLAAVARGDYDFYIDEWAAEAARFGKPLFLRFAHEMNDPYRYPWGPQHNTKEEFIDAWRHVWSRFNRAGATNVIWTWSPHIAVLYWDTYYPGDEYVDWVATGVLNFGAIGLQWSEWWTFQEIFGQRYSRLASFGKPIMIPEFGSLAVGGDRAAWYRDALTNLPDKYPDVKAVVFFHTQADQTVTYQVLDWSITGDATLARAIAEAIAPWTAHTR
jgi:hypothetical protein